MLQKISMNPAMRAPPIQVIVIVATMGLRDHREDRDTIIIITITMVMGRGKVMERGDQRVRTRMRRCRNQRVLGPRESDYVMKGKMKVST